MNCVQCQERLTDYLEGLLEPQDQEQVGRHLDSCAVCQAVAAEQRDLQERLAADARALTPDPIEDAVMNEILKEQAFKLRRTAMTKRYGGVGLGVAAAAALAVVLFVPWGGMHSGHATAAEVLQQAVQALSDLHSVYIKLDVRTIPHDNFQSIALDYPLVPHEMWKEFGPTPKYRVEKPGRVVAMDGRSSLLLINVADQRDLGSKGGPDANFVGWMKRLLDVDEVLDSERRSAERYGWDLQLTEEKGPDGMPQWVVTIETKALGDFTNDWMKNKTLSDSDQRRVYRFNAETKRLEDLEVWVYVGEEQILALNITEIVYNPEIDPDLWVIDAPDGTIWARKPEVLPDNDKYARMTPDRVARAFFQALADEDWDEALKFYPWSDFTQDARDTYGGLKIIEIGEPFQSGDYSGWFVPYKVELESGFLWFGVKKHNLALRNDNQAGRYVVDGGF